MTRSIIFALCAVLGSAAAARGAGGMMAGMNVGTPDIKMAGPLTFGPEGVLFVGDPTGAAVFAIDTKDAPKNAPAKSVTVNGIDAKIAALLGTTAADILINDMAVNPASGVVYLSVSRGRGPDAQPVVLKVAGDGQISQLTLDNVSFSKAELPNAPAAAAAAPGATPTGAAPRGRGRNQRGESITDMAYNDGQLIIAGLSNEEFASKLRTVAYPFADVSKGASIEIYHGSHAQLETRSPVRTFATYKIGSEPYMLAAYTCTPLVKIPMSKLKSTEKVMGDTVAELGAGNQPLDMIVYQKDGKDFVLLSNSAHGVMKVDLAKVADIELIKTPVRGTAGLPFEKIASAQGVLQLDRLNATQAVLLSKTADGINLTTMDLP